MQASSIPTKFPEAFAAKAAPGFVRSIPQTTGDPTAASLDLGFPPATATQIASGGTPPNIQDANGILLQITQWLQWISAGGALQAYDAPFQAAIGGYPNGAIVASATTAGLYWRSTVDSNTTNPDTGGAGWVVVVGNGIIGFGARVTGSAQGGNRLASWSVPQIVVGSALGGITYLGTNLNLNFNGGNVGANGMDQAGAFPTSSALSIYVIYNPATNTWATLGTTACNGTTYTGANLPAGFTSSCLLWSGMTDATPNLAAFAQNGHTVKTGVVTIFFQIAGQTNLTAQSIASAVPPNALSASGNLFTSNTTGFGQAMVASNTAGVGTQYGDYSTADFTGIGNNLNFVDVPILSSTPQTICWAAGNTSGNCRLYIYGYTF